MNPEGKKQYGRDFLLQFQSDCKDKPEGLPHIPDIVLEKVWLAKLKSLDIMPVI